MLSPSRVTERLEIYFFFLFRQRDGAPVPGRTSVAVFGRRDATAGHGVGAKWRSTSTAAAVRKPRVFTAKVTRPARSPRSLLPVFRRKYTVAGSLSARDIVVADITVSWRGGVGRMSRTEGYRFQDGRFWGYECCIARNGARASPDTTI